MDIKGKKKKGTIETYVETVDNNRIGRMITEFFYDMRVSEPEDLGSITESLKEKVADEKWTNDENVSAATVLMALSFGWLQDHDDAFSEHKVGFLHEALDGESDDDGEFACAMCITDRLLSSHKRYTKEEMERGTKEYAGALPAGGIRLRSRLSCSIEGLADGAAFPDGDLCIIDDIPAPKIATAEGNPYVPCISYDGMKDEILSPWTVGFAERAVKGACGNVLVFGGGLSYEAFLLAKMDEVNSICIADPDDELCELTEKIVSFFPHHEKIRVMKDICIGDMKNGGYSLAIVTYDGSLIHTDSYINLREAERILGIRFVWKCRNALNDKVLEALETEGDEIMGLTGPDDIYDDDYESLEDQLMSLMSVNGMDDELREEVHDHVTDVMKERDARIALRPYIENVEIGTPASIKEMFSWDMIDKMLSCDPNCADE